LPKCWIDYPLNLPQIQCELARISAIFVPPPPSFLLDAKMAFYALANCIDDAAYADLGLPN
jgi:hypothetical protein